MVNISNLLNNLNEQDQKHFLTLRNLMRKTYLTCVNQTVGLNAYTHEDDSFLDTIDLKLQTLMHRSGRIMKHNSMPDLMAGVRGSSGGVQGNIRGVNDLIPIDNAKRGVVTGLLDKVVARF